MWLGGPIRGIKRNCGWNFGDFFLVFTTSCQWDRSCTLKLLLLVSLCFIVDYLHATLPLSIRPATSHWACRCTAAAVNHCADMPLSTISMYTFPPRSDHHTH